MIDLTLDDFRGIVSEARLAPSVHNVQPSRWRLDHGKVELYGDPVRAIPVADPDGRDWRLSHGASFEGLALALAQKGIALDATITPSNQHASQNGPLELVASGTLRPWNENPPRIEPVASRMSWRGSFEETDAEMRIRLDSLAEMRDDLLLVRDRAFIEHAARLADRAGLHFLRDDAHRRELLHWMRLSPSHLHYARDGLNAQAMHLGTLEAYGAGLVLGPFFPALDRMGLAPKFLSEYAKSSTASAIALFHRPVGEDAFHSGRAFYRAWLAMERTGFKAVPMSVLADWPVARNALHRLHGLDDGRFIVSAFRIGRPKGQLPSARARLPVDELIV